MGASARARSAARRAASAHCRSGRANAVQRACARASCAHASDKGRIQRHRLLVGGNRLAETRRVERAHPLRGGLAPQEGIVGGQVLGGLRRQLVFDAVPQRHVQRLRHLSRDVGLHLEHVGQRGIESLLPLRRGGRARCDPDQLGADPYPAGPIRVLLPADGAGQQVLGPQLACDLLRGLARPSVLVRAGPGNDGEARELRQLAPDLVAHPVREVGLGRVAQVLEREHGQHLRTAGRPPLSG